MDNGRMGLEHRIALLCRESQDRNYTEYLEILLKQLRQGMITEQYAAGELNRTYPLYQRRMGMVPQQGMQPVVPQYTQVQYAAWQQYPQQLQYIPQPQVQQYVPQQGVQMQAPQYIPLQNVQLQYMQPSYVPQQMYVQPPKAKRKNMEFAVGAGVLSVVGVLFVLTALVMLGINYMNSMMKGMCLYGAAAAVLLFSELYLVKKLPKFAFGITGFGICCLYLVTMLNYLYFANFNSWIALGITVLISLLAALLGRKRDSGTLKIIGFAGCYICMFPISGALMGEHGRVQAMYFGFITIIILFANLVTVLLPVKKNCVRVHICHLITNTVFALLFSNLACIYLENFSCLLLFLVVMVLVQGVIFYKLEKPYFDSGRHAGRAGSIAVYVTMSGLLLLYFVILSLLAVRDGFGTVFHLSAGMLLAVCGALFLLFKKSSLKWIQYWLFCPTVLLAYNLRLIGAAVSVWFTGDSLRWWRMGVTLAVFASAKILARKKILRVSELLITIFTALQAVAAFINYDMLLRVSAGYPGKAADLAGSLICVFCFPGAFLLSLAALHYWKSIYEEIVMCVFGAFILILFRNGLTPAILMCILFTGVILFNSVEFFRGKHIKIFNYLNMTLMACLYLASAFEKNNILHGVMLVLGISFMVLAFREQFGMDFKIKGIVFVLFLCYMVLIWNIPVPILKSVVLMVVAIGAVAAGFNVRQKKMRITGLALTLAVCAKVLLYDFSGAATVEKIVLFLIVGLIALAISGIYLALEKKMV